MALLFKLLTRQVVIGSKPHNNFLPLVHDAKQEFVSRTDVASEKQRKDHVSHSVSGHISAMKRVALLFLVSPPEAQRLDVTCPCMNCLPFLPQRHHFDLQTLSELEECSKEKANEVETLREHRETVVGRYFVFLNAYRLG